MAQAAFGIRGLEAAALLQFGDHQFDKVLVAFRRHRPRQVDAVDTGFLQPGFQFVGHAGRIADQGRITAAEAEAFQQLASGQRTGLRGLRSRLDGVAVAVVDRIVEPVAGEVDPGAAGEVGQPGLGAGVLPVLVEFLLCLVRGPADHHRHPDEDFQVLGTAAGTDGLRAQAVDQLARPRLVGRGDKDAFGVTGGEALAAVGRAGLEQYRRALPRRFGQVIAIEPVERSLVPDAMHPGRIGIDPRRLVAAHRAVLPAALPQLVQQFEVVVGTLVALVVCIHGRQAHRPCAAVQVAGDDIPAGAAAGQVIKRGHAAGEQIRRFVAQVGGHAKAQVLRHGGHRRHQQQRIVDRQLDRFLQRQVDRLLVHVVDTDDVGDKQAVKQPALQRGRQPGPVAQRIEIDRVIARMRPQPVIDMPHAVHVERVDQQLFLAHYRAP